MIEELPFYNKILIILINLIGVWLTAMVYQNDSKKILNKIFLGMATFMFLWVNFAYFSRLFGKDQYYLSLVFLKIAWFATPVLFILLYFLVVYLLKKEKKHKLLNKFVLLFGVIIALITGFTNLVVNDIKFINGDLTIIYGSGMLLFLGVVFFFMCAPLYVLFIEYPKIDLKEKIKMNYLLFGIFAFYLANIIFNIFLPLVLGIIHFYWIGDYSAIFLLTFTAYAITKHNLMGVKTLITQTLMVIIIIILIIDTFVLSNDLTMQLLKAGTLITFIYFGNELIKSVKKEKKAREELESAYGKINQYIAKLKETNKNLEEKNKDFLALLKVNEKATETLDSRKIAQSIMDIIPKYLKHLGYIGGIFILYDREKKSVSAYAITESKIVKKAKEFLGKPFGEHSEDINKADNFVINTIKTKKVHIGGRLENFISPTVSKNTCRLIQRFVKARSFISIPIFSGGRVIGTIVFVGAKPKEKICQRDKDILKGFSLHIGTAIENAQLYEKTNRQKSELSKLNRDFEAANRKLNRLLDIKNEFLHITSHQLRTPLTAIRGMVSMWYHGDFDKLSEERKKEMLKRICISTERLNNITNDMLDTLELEGETLRFKFIYLSLKDVIKEIIDTLKPNFDKKGLYIKFNCEKNLPKIKAEPKYIRQAFMNLIDNASKYTKEGGVDISIKKRNTKCIEVIIKDTGIGIEKKDQSKLFQKFSRSQNAVAENVSGSGLGLFIVKKIIDRHNGKIEIKSEGAGKGTSVAVRLRVG